MKGLITSLSWRIVDAGQVHKPPASTRSSWITINAHHAGAGHGARGLAGEAARYLADVLT